MNTITITGRAGKDPELRYTSSGDAVATLSVADDENRKTDSGWEKVGTTWWRCTAWRKDAERMADAIRKGDRVVVSGRAKLREYETRDGDKGTSLEVAVQSWGMQPSESAADSHSGGGSSDDTNVAPF